jgi:hypothetical protein
MKCLGKAESIAPRQVLESGSPSCRFGLAVGVERSGPLGRNRLKRRRLLEISCAVRSEGRMESGSLGCRTPKPGGSFKGLWTFRAFCLSKAILRSAARAERSALPVRDFHENSGA